MLTWRTGAAVMRARAPSQAGEVDGPSAQCEARPRRGHRAAARSPRRGLLRRVAKEVAWRPVCANRPSSPLTPSASPKMLTFPSAAMVTDSAPCLATLQGDIRGQQLDTASANPWVEVSACKTWIESVRPSEYVALPSHVRCTAGWGRRSGVPDTSD